MLRILRPWIIGAALLIPAVTLARGPVTLTVPASADTTLYEDSEGLVSNGAGMHVYVARTRGSLLRRALVRFDLSSVPPDAIVASATLTLHQSRASNSSDEGEPVSIHRVLTAWGEGASDAGDPGGGGAIAETDDATWVHRFHASQAWAQPGGDFAPAPSALALVTRFDGPASWSSPGVAADVQGWVAAPATNSGWIIRGPEASGFVGHRFGSREHPEPPERPSLTVVYSLPNPACNLADITEIGGTEEAPGTPDGQLTVDDLILFVNLFSAGPGCPGTAPCNRADVTGIGGGGAAPDGDLTVDDLIEFFNAFSEGC